MSAGQPAHDPPQQVAVAPLPDHDLHEQPLLGASALAGRASVTGHVAGRAANVAPDRLQAGGVEAVLLQGVAFALMIMAVAAAEVTVGLALVIAIIRTRQTAEVDQYADLKE